MMWMIDVVWVWTVLEKRRWAKWVGDSWLVDAEEEHTTHVGQVWDRRRRAQVLAGIPVGEHAYFPFLGVGFGRRLHILALVM